MARYQSQDLAPCSLASPDAGWAIFKDEDFPGLVLQRELLQADAVARRIGFAVLDRLGRNQMLRGAERQLLEPASDEGLGA